MYTFYHVVLIRFLLKTHVISQYIDLVTVKDIQTIENLHHSLRF